MIRTSLKTAQAFNVGFLHYGENMIDRIYFLFAFFCAASCSQDDAIEGFEVDEDGFLGFECLSSYCDQQVECLEAGQVEGDGNANGIGLVNRCQYDLEFDAVIHSSIGTAFWIEDSEKRLALPISTASLAGGDVFIISAGQQIEAFFDEPPFSNTRFVECVDEEPRTTLSPDEQITIAFLLPHPVIEDPIPPPQPPSVSRFGLGFPDCHDAWQEYSASGPFIRSYAKVPYR
jgi:hypothetical protein